MSLADLLLEANDRGVLDLAVRIVACVQAGPEDGRRTPDEQDRINNAIAFNQKQGKSNEKAANYQRAFEARLAACSTDAAAGYGCATQEKA